MLIAIGRPHQYKILFYKVLHKFKSVFFLAFNKAFVISIEIYCDLS
jgi:hypothetical protein